MTDVYEHRTVVDWDTYFLALVKQVAEKSKDPSTQCGAVLVNQNHKIIGTGFNGPPSDLRDECVPWNKRPEKYAYIIHAEENALWDAVESRGLSELAESTMYCTHYPCTECVLRMIRCKVRTVVVPNQHPPYAMSKYQVDAKELLSIQKYPKLNIRYV